MPNQTIIWIAIGALGLIIFFLLIVIIAVVVFMKKRKAKQLATEQNAAKPGEFQSQTPTPELQPAPSWPEPTPQTQQPAWPEPSARETNVSRADAGTYSGAYSYEQESSSSSAQQYVDQDRAAAAP